MKNYIQNFKIKKNEKHIIKCIGTYSYCHGGHWHHCENTPTCTYWNWIYYHLNFILQKRLMITGMIEPFGILIISESKQNKIIVYQVS